jgi:hypothetical protein
MNFIVLGFELNELMDWIFYRGRRTIFVCAFSTTAASVTTVS